MICILKICEFILNRHIYLLMACTWISNRFHHYSTAQSLVNWINWSAQNCVCFEVKSISEGWWFNEMTNKRMHDKLFPIISQTHCRNSAPPIEWWNRKICVFSFDFPPDFLVVPLLTAEYYSLVWHPLSLCLFRSFAFLQSKLCNRRESISFMQKRQYNQWRE